jgi:uncharacterized protein YciI
MADRIAYFYFMKDEAERVGGLVPDHVRYWAEHAPPGYLGGPFADRSGGLIIFDAGSTDEAERLVAGDPFVTEDVLSSSWLKPWRPQAH